MSKEHESLLKKFEIENAKADPTEEELFDVLVKQIEYMLEHKTEYLFSLMYRMDVKQKLVAAALDPDAIDPAHVGLAKLVMLRQKERNATREKYKQPIIDDLDEELKY